MFQRFYQIGFAINDVGEIQIPTYNSVEYPQWVYLPTNIVFDSNSFPVKNGLSNVTLKLSLTLIKS